MGTMKELSPSHVRIFCDCGEYVHDVFVDPDNAEHLAFESFQKTKGKAVEVTTEETPETPAAIAPKKKPHRVGLFKYKE
jgi:hypothetical protein